MKNQKIYVGLLGLGTIGSGVYELLQKNKKVIESRTGVSIEIKKILVRDINKPRKIKVKKELLTTNFEEILQDGEIKIICELMGGIEPACTYILQALEAGKEIVTANKAVLAEKGEKVWERAQSLGRFVGFEASVAGGIPVIKVLRESLSGNNIKSITGILNGTTNYILTRMQEENLSFKKALKEAQKKGYAESDPTLDINGSDSAHKLSILASLAFGTYIPGSQVYKEGIEDVELMDIKFAETFGYNVKLIAVARKLKKGLDLRVHPALIPQKAPLSSVRLNYNAVFIQGDFAGDIMLAGLGAGKEPTASAVVSDIISASEHVLFNKKSFLKYPFTKGDNLFKILSIEDLKFEYYFRFQAVDKPGVLSRIAGILGAHEISIASVIQMGREKRGGTVPIVMITHEAEERKVKEALKKIETLDCIKPPVKKLRILN